MNNYILEYSDFISLFESEILEDAILEDGNAGEAVEGLLGAILLFYNKNKIPDIIPNEKDLEKIFSILKSTLGKDGALYQKGDDEHWEKQDVLVSAFSGAMALQKYLKGDDIENVWRTGRTWPKELVDYGLNSIGGKDYNSSDIVVKYGKNKYLGVSLKVKPLKSSADPTIINKSLSAILDKKTAEELGEIMTMYFEKISKDFIDDLVLFPDFKAMPKTFKSFFSKNYKDKLITDDVFIKKYYTGKVKNGVRLIDASREIINKALYNKNNDFYKKIREVLKEDVTPKFVDSIYDSIFKPKITNLDLSERGIEFSLILLTGYQKINKKNANKVEAGEIQEYNTITNLLAKIATNEDKISIEFEDPEISLEEGTTSAIYGKLTIGNLPLANISLRFKGNFSSLSGMAFQANISKEFKEKLKNTY